MPSRRCSIVCEVLDPAACRSPRGRSGGRCSRTRAAPISVSRASMHLLDLRPRAPRRASRGRAAARRSSGSSTSKCSLERRCASASSPSPRRACSGGQRSSTIAPMMLSSEIEQALALLGERLRTSATLVGQLDRARRAVVDPRRFTPQRRVDARAARSDSSERERLAVVDGPCVTMVARAAVGVARRATRIGASNMRRGCGRRRRRRAPRCVCLPDSVGGGASAGDARLAVLVDRLGRVAAARAAAGAARRSSCAAAFITSSYSSRFLRMSKLCSSTLLLRVLDRSW